MDTATLIYEPYPYPELHHAARQDALDLTEGKHAVPLDRMDGTIGELGVWAAQAYGLNEPHAGLVHRNAALGNHRDTLNPYPCLNLVVFYRAHMGGGHLIFEDGPTLACDDGWVAVFDGQRAHGMSALEPKAKGGYRVSVTFYCPTP